jgi:hypothetical protein
VTTDERCVPVFDDDGNVIARAQVSADATDEDMRVIAAIVRAAQRYVEEQDAADPEAAAERGRRQEAGQARIRERNARLRGEPT